uniref:Uncharacterized protein n=1 Tax=Oryza nivara TaxID=4536 RepID=A0A0E0IXS3_ORYNI
MEQCEDRGGRYLRQVSQNFTFTVKPLTVTSFDLRNLIRGVLPELHSIDGVVEPRNSSTSGGALVFLGTIPGSLADGGCIRANNKASTTQEYLQNEGKPVYLSAMKLKKLKPDRWSKKERKKEQVRCFPSRLGRASWAWRAAAVGH